ncbi:obtusifoliol 14-alpha demethylase [Nannochloropsis gaditana]|uniref:Obtusifoliol 14-alpha demethylase n=1 Tax=Nannochloropsis gaditana TaxID=72520 RepID=W7TY24_9STRA|nr:obtusifoliol 14-alpha demethylase [Nannochloropsis gaditana]
MAIKMFLINLPWRFLRAFSKGASLLRFLFRRLTSPAIRDAVHSSFDMMISKQLIAAHLPLDQPWTLAAIGLSAAFLAFICVFFLLTPRSRKDTPPVIGNAWPLFGHFFLFLKSPINLIKSSYQTYGSVFTVNLFTQRMTFLIGPEAAAAFFKASDKELGQDEVYGFMKAVFGEGVVYDSDPKKRNLQMQRTANALKSGRLRTYVEKISEETEAFFKGWGEAGEVDICEALSDLIILTASRCLHGDDVRQELFAEVSKLYNDLDQGITPVSVLFPNLPIPSHWKRDAARKEMVKLFSKVIQRRRAAGAAEAEARTDILQVFMDIEYKDGSKITDDEVTGLLIALLFAGQHTSSITSSWTALYLAQNKGLQDRVYAEQVAIRGQDTGSEAALRALDFDAVGKMDMLFNCLREALRMHPPLIMLMRQCRQDLLVQSQEGKAFTVPKGSVVAVSPSVQQRLPSLFPAPDSFDPDRFAPPREEHKPLFAYVPFGGGLHACLGQQFAYVQLKTVLSLLFSKFELTLATPDGAVPPPNYHAMVVGPTAPCTVKYRRR